MPRAVLRCFLLVIICQGGSFGQQTRPKEDVCLYSIHQTGYQSERFEQNVEDRLMELTKRVDEVDLAQKRQIESSLQTCLNETQKRDDENAKIYEILKEQQKQMESMLQAFANRSHEEQNMKDLVQVLCLNETQKRENENGKIYGILKEQQKHMEYMLQALLNTSQLDQRSSESQGIKELVDVLRKHWDLTSFEDISCPRPDEVGSVEFPPRCCSFPFTSNGQLHYRCIPGVNGFNQCLIQKRIWATCQEPSDFVAVKNSTIVTIPFVARFPVVRVHNWIVLQQRIDGSVSFNRSWEEYKAGFGKHDGNFWLGLEKVHKMTNNAPYKLRIEFMLTNGSWYSAEYDTFRVDNEVGNYKIHVTGYSGDSGDVMHSSTGNYNTMPFSTYDRGPRPSTASSLGGGWWHDNGGHYNLNGLFGSNFGFDIESRGCTSHSTSRMMMKKI